MLPPVLEVYVVWHPGDTVGAAVADEFVRHFHGTLFTGLIGGAVEVYVRSQGWRDPGDTPRPIPFPGVPLPNGVAEAQFVAVVPVLGMEFAAEVEAGAGRWWDYAAAIAASQAASVDRVGIFPILADRDAVDGTELGRILGRFEDIGGESADTSSPESLCRDLAQGITQLASGAVRERLTVFISHTRDTRGERPEIRGLIDLVRSTIGRTRLNQFFDMNDLQPGVDWDRELRAHASASALLAVRTDLYASREWCQREMLIAKREGMPIVILNVLEYGEKRGSFLMDHVPRVPVRRTPDGWSAADIGVGIDILVDECLKRALWKHQGELARQRPDLEISWWAPHAPEPTTLAAWLATEHEAGRLGGTEPMRILHPDPPLGADEKLVLDQMVTCAGIDGVLDIMTPRLLAARGG